MKSPKFYTYVILDPRTDLPFYTGKGSGRRMYLHGSKQDNRRTRERISEIKACGLKLIYEKWIESDDESYCYWMEIYIIEYFGRQNLCNISPGGLGAVSGDNHPSKDPKFRALISAVHKGKIGPSTKFQKGVTSGENHPRFGTQYPPSPNKGKKFPERSGPNHHMFGKRQSEKNIQALREANIGRTPWNKGKKRPEISGPNHPMFGKHPIPWNKGKEMPEISGSNHHMFGKHHSDEMKAKMSAGRKGKMLGESNPMFGRHLISPMKGKHHSEESRKKMSESRMGTRTGAANHNFGKPMSEETKSKMIATKKARRASLSV